MAICSQMDSNSKISSREMQTKETASTHNNNNSFTIITMECPKLSSSRTCSSNTNMMKITEKKSLRLTRMVCLYNHQRRSRTSSMRFLASSMRRRRRAALKMKHTLLTLAPSAWMTCSQAKWLKH